MRKVKQKPCKLPLRTHPESFTYLYHSINGSTGDNGDLILEFLEREQLKLHEESATCPL